MQREGKIKLPSLEFMNNLADHIQDPAERLIELVSINGTDKIKELIILFKKLGHL